MTKQTICFVTYRRSMWNASLFVMAGLVPAIHAPFYFGYQDVDAHKPGHDEGEIAAPSADRTHLEQFAVVAGRAECGAGGRHCSTAESDRESQAAYRLPIAAWELSTRGPQGLYQIRRHHAEHVAKRAGKMRRTGEASGVGGHRQGGAFATGANGRANPVPDAVAP